MKNFYNTIKRQINRISPKNKKILVTGSSGFIGQHLIDLLVELGNGNNKIFGIDIVQPKIKYENFKFIKKSLFKIKNSDLPKIKFDYVVHLAGIPSPTYYKKNPIGTIYLNSNLTEILIKKCLRDKSKFIYFSSSEIYGNPSSEFIPTKENFNGNVSSISDRSCYDESKRMGETLTYIYKNYYNLDAKIIRPFNFYGNGMKSKDKRIIPQFFYQSLKNRNITVFDKGLQTRSYCHINDAIIMIVHIIFKGKNFVYNVGNPNEEKNALEIAQLIKKICKSNNNITKISYPKDYPSDEPLRRCPNIQKFIKEFGYKPKINLQKGLEEFKNYASDNF